MTYEQLSFLWGIPWWDAGFTTIPNILFDHHAEAGVTSAEFLFIVHLIRHEDVALSTIAGQMGISVSQVQRLRASLEAKGLLIVTETPGQPSDYSFGNLARRLLQIDQGTPSFTGGVS